MKKIYNRLFFALALFSLAACGGKDEPVIKPDTGGGSGSSSDGDVEVKIYTTEIQTKAAVLEFGSGAKMNIYPKTFGRIDAPNIVDNVVASYDGANWTLSPAVKLNEAQDLAFIYAVAPYDAAYTDPQKIPVDLAKQVDLMYSGYYVPASRTSPAVKLTMQHALSLLTFNIASVNYSGAGKLQSLAINGEMLYNKGEMDASSGKISLTEKGEVKNTFNKNIEAGGWTSDIPGLWVLPFNTKAGAVTLTAVIDGKSYETVIPEVEVKSAWQYIFRLVLTNNGLEIDPSKTETISLNVITDSKPEFEGYGVVVLTASGSWLNSPLVDGDGVFGTMSSPKGSSSYNGSVKVEGLNSGDKVTVEAWNSDGFELQTLDGIGTIDVSGYE